MTTTTTTQSSPLPTTSHEIRYRKAARRKLIGGVLGAAALGAVALAAINGGASGSPPSSPAPDPPATVVQQPQWTEVFGGCLNDIECHGDASLRPTPMTVSPELPGYTAVD